MQIKVVRFGGTMCALVAGVVLLGCQASSHARPAGMSMEATEAVQALRLMGAVQITRFSTAGGYGTVEELKKAEMLDPQWPRVNAEAYLVACEAEKERFVCYADALRVGDPWFRIDDTQKVRTEPGRRPTATSPMGGRSKAGGNL